MAPDCTDVDTDADLEVGDFGRAIPVKLGDPNIIGDPTDEFAEFTAAGYPLHLTSVKADKGLEELRGEHALLDGNGGAERRGISGGPGHP